MLSETANPSSSSSPRRHQGLSGAFPRARNARQGGGGTGKCPRYQGFASKSGGAAPSRKEPTVPPSGSLFPPAPRSSVLAARGEGSPCTPFFFEAKPAPRVDRL